MSNSQEQGRVGLGIIGLGGRGRTLMRMLLEMEDIHIPAICETDADRARMASDQAVASGRPVPECYADYHELLARDDIQGVVIASSWISHIEISIAAMKAGKYAASEVAGASSIEECRDLVRTSESTGIPC